MSLKAFLVMATGLTVTLTLLVIPATGDSGSGDEWPGRRRSSDVHKVDGNRTDDRGSGR